ncbi:hypothetical protein RhiJN_23178 [Ceratobasidium sp. AG-Ba]|nr:hypothetical protein RhiJN_23178 [Ceratobasidium sp. AG-Ba]
MIVPDPDKARIRDALISLSEAAETLAIAARAVSRAAWVFESMVGNSDSGTTEGTIVAALDRSNNDQKPAASGETASLLSPGTSELHVSGTEGIENLLAYADGGSLSTASSENMEKAVTDSKEGFTRQIDKASEGPLNKDSSDSVLCTGTSIVDHFESTFAQPSSAIPYVQPDQPDLTTPNEIGIYDEKRDLAANCIEAATIDSQEEPELQSESLNRVSPSEANNLVSVHRQDTTASSTPQIPTNAVPLRPVVIMMTEVRCTIALNRAFDELAAVAFLCRHHSKTICLFKYWDAVQSLLSPLVNRPVLFSLASNPAKQTKIITEFRSKSTAVLLWPADTELRQVEKLSKTQIVHIGGLSDINEGINCARMTVVTTNSALSGMSKNGKKKFLAYCPITVHNSSFNDCGPDSVLQSYRISLRESLADDTVARSLYTASISYHVQNAGRSPQEAAIQSNHYARDALLRGSYGEDLLGGRIHLSAQEVQAYGLQSAVKGGSIIVTSEVSFALAGIAACSQALAAEYL